MNATYDPERSPPVEPEGGTWWEPEENPADYVANRAIVDAVNVALLLGQPLLLTGEPGTGKTQLAYSVAYALGLAKPLKLEVKSTTVARDLFYTYDSFGQYLAVQTRRQTEARDFFTLNALGLAIVRSQPLDRHGDLLCKEQRYSRATRSVVLIDEIDKAPRDFPNDLLNEIENLYFRIPELENRAIEASRELRPIVIITSNSEQDLPDAFLRRCIFYHIAFPDLARLRKILEGRVGTAFRSKTPLIDDLLAVFALMRDPTSGMRKLPSTAELLDWASVLSRHDDPFGGEQPPALRTLSTVAKTQEDQALLQGLVARWIKSRPQRP